MPIHSALTRGFATVDEAFAVAVTVAHPADAASTRGVAHPKPVILPDVPAGTSGLPMVPPAAVDSGGDRPDAPAETPPGYSSSNSATSSSAVPATCNGTTETTQSGRRWYTPRARSHAALAVSGPKQASSSSSPRATSTSHWSERSTASSANWGSASSSGSGESARTG